MNMGIDLSDVKLNSQTGIKDATARLRKKGVLILKLSKKERNLLNENDILSEGRYLVFQSVHCVGLIVKKETFIVSDPTCPMMVEHNMKWLKKVLHEKKNRGHFTIRKVCETKRRKRRLNEKHDDLVVQSNKKFEN